MISAYIILLCLILLWKLFFVWKRGVRAYTYCIKEYSTFYEYLLGNGVDSRKAHRPFICYALKKAFKPLLTQWRLFLFLVALGILVFLLN